MPNSKQLKRKDLPEQKQAREKLPEALLAGKTHRDLLPICAWCRQVRDDKGCWKNLNENVGVRFTYGICPSCSERVSREASTARARRSPAEG